MSAEEHNGQAAPTARRRDRRAHSPKRAHIDATIEKLGVASVREIADVTGYTLKNVRNHLAQLRRDGRVEMTNARARARNQRYRLAA